MIDPELQQLWSDVVAAARAEVLRHDQSPDVLVPRAHSLELTMPLDEHLRWSYRVRQEWLVTNGPERIAADFYAAYTKARSPEPGATS